MEIKYLHLDELTPYERNPRTQTKEQIAQIAASTRDREFGFTNPMLIDGNKGVIAGHGHLAAAKILGNEKVPCIDLSHLTEEQKRAYIIDNKLALNGNYSIRPLKM